MRKRIGTRGFAAALAAAIVPALLVTPLARAGRAGAAPTTDLRLMEFNIEDGGTIVAFSSIVRAIHAADPDVIAVEEGQGNIPRLAKATGYPYFDVRLQVISRLPLIDPPHGNGHYLFVEVSPGHVVALGNVHLPAGPYSPNLTLRGASRRTILEIERRVRVPAEAPAVTALSRLADQGIPAFLTGDFNSPSPLDWTPAEVGLRPQITFPVNWPAGAYVMRHGFHDSYRDVHPDPIADPGLTWPSGRPHPPGVWSPGPHAPADRIDFIYASAGAQTVASETIGESGGPGVSIGIDPWGTDHRSTMSEFSVAGGVPPTFVAPAERLVAAGADEPLTFHAPGTAGERVLVTPAGGGAGHALADVSTGGVTDGTVVVSTDGWAPGTYVATLVDGAAVLSRMRFWVEAPGAKPAVWTPRTSYALGEPVRVRWADAPGERWDWIGVYERGADPLKASYLTWFYTHTAIQGSGLLDADAEGPWPLQPGRYSVYLLADDGYRVLARGSFTVTG